MKKINFILTCCLMLILSSCSNDDAAFPVNVQDTTSLTSVLTTNATLSTPGGSLDFTVTLPQSFSESSIVTVSAVVGGIYETTAEVTINAGETVGNGTITMPTNSPIAFGLSTASKVSVKGLRLVNITQDENGNDVVTNSNSDNFRLSSNSIDISLVNLIGNTLQIDWTGDSSIDIDFIPINLDSFQFPAAGLQNAATTSKPEFLPLDNGNAGLVDGNYAILYRSFSSSEGPVDITANIFDTTGTTTNTYSVTVNSIANPLAPSGGWFIGNVFLNATKATDANGKVTWTFSVPQ